ncbi:MAG: hypothetical protein C4523_14305 [Myxococcales bacterium]|nr:MAG: hypothetical protein C4523_14305 [Myxococcales bacterium]
MKPKTLKIACDEFVEHLRDTGVPETSLSSYAWNLRLLVGHFGEEKELGKILAAHVANFFRSESVTTKAAKGGERVPRTVGSISQIRRVTRWALVWWNEKGWIDKVPLPADEKRFLEPKADGDEEKPGKRGRKTKTEASDDDGGLKADAADQSPVGDPGDGVTGDEPADRTAETVGELDNAPVAIDEPRTATGSDEGRIDGQDANAGEKLTLL